MKDLIDDNSIEDESDSESDDDVAGVKRKRRDDDDELDDQLCDEDLELLEENTGQKFKVRSLTFSAFHQTIQQLVSSRGKNDSSELKGWRMNLMRKAMKAEERETP